MSQENNIVKLFTDEVLSKMNQREREVICSRFGVGVDPAKTLEEIGSSFQNPITRERVRQIQEGAIIAIGRITAKITDLVKIRNTAKEVLKTSNYGVGILSQDRLVSEVIAKLALPVDDKDLRGVVDILVHAEDQIGRSRPILGVRPYFFDLDNMKMSNVKSLRKIFVEALPKDEAIPVDEFYETVSKVTAYDVKDIAQIVELFPEIVINEGQAALEKIKILNPKTLRDKARYILRSKGVPTHFRDIARAINEKFPEADGDEVKFATVHNELIRHSEFVLVGRGIYALQLWGYQPGTVLQVITQILKKAGEAMSVEDITKAVNKKRVVKSATVYMNLQNKDIITRV